MESVSGQIDVGWRDGIVEVGQSQMGLVGARPTPIPALVQTLQTPVPEATDHVESVSPVPVRMASPGDSPPLVEGLTGVLLKRRVKGPQHAGGTRSGRIDETSLPES